MKTVESLEQELAILMFILTIILFIIGLMAINTKYANELKNE